MTKNKDLDAAIDNLLKTYKTPEEIVGENGLLQQLKEIADNGKSTYFLYDDAGDRPLALALCFINNS